MYVCMHARLRSLKVQCIDAHRNWTTLLPQNNPTCLASWPGLDPAKKSSLSGQVKYQRKSAPPHHAPSTPRSGNSSCCRICSFQAMLDEFIHLDDFCMLLLLSTEQCVHAHKKNITGVHTPIHILSGMPLTCLCKPSPPKESYLHVLRLLHEGVLHGVIVTSGC